MELNSKKIKINENSSKEKKHEDKNKIRKRILWEKSIEDEVIQVESSKLNKLQK